MDFFVEGLGGVPILPLKSLHTSHNPLQTAGLCPEPAGLPPRPANGAGLMDDLEVILRRI